MSEGSNNARARVEAAQAELTAAETTLAHTVEPWRAKLTEHRTALVLAGGLATGLAVALLPTRWWGRIGALAGSIAGTLGAAAAKSFVTPAVMGAALARKKAAGDGSTLH